MQQSFENRPASKRPAVGLSVDTSRDIEKGKQAHVSPPRTPKMENHRPNKGNIAENRALKVRTGQRDRGTFLEDITPVDPSRMENEPERGRLDRDSHDLSLSPRQITRDSLVDHMLLSLDQFSFGQDDFGRQPTVDEEQLYNTFQDEEPYQPTSNFAPRARGPGHSYSYSSDYDNADDSSKYSGGQLSRGRRSNSSSNFQTGLSRINSKRGDLNSSFSSTRNGPQIPPRGVHSRSGKGSKGSSANSFDLGYAQVSGNQRWAHGLAGRSSSFDYGSDGRTLIQASPSRHADSPVSHFNNNSYDYDAAPTPTVPVGPRRLPLSPTVLPPESPRADMVSHKLERKRSTKSSKSAYKGKLSTNTGGRVDYGLRDPAQPLPPMPAFIKESAPSPSVGYEKAKESPAPAQPAKEKPGFFRRVFGSRSTPAIATQDPPRSHGSTTSAETADRPSSKPQHIGNQIKSPPTLPPPPPPPKEHTHVLTKKPSSFFRRRKKSVSEAEAPPPPIVPPLALQPEKDLASGRAAPSPVSSLRKVMNPYLRTPARSPDDPFPQASIDRQLNDTQEPIDRNVRGFSPDYTPDKSATIRAVTKRRESVDNLSSAHASAQKPLPSRPGSPARDKAQPDGDVTFLQDESDNDKDASISGDKELLEPNHPPWQHKSPAVARDMALVAEYERTHSRRSPTPLKSEPAKSSPIGSSPLMSKEAAKQTTVSPKDEEWVMLTPTKVPNPAEDKEQRVWLEPSSSEEDLSPNIPSHLKAGEQPRRFSGSTGTDYKSATSLPLVQVDGEEVPETPASYLMSAAEAIKSLDDDLPSPEVVPTNDDRERAKKIYDGNEDFIQKEKAAAWLGEDGPLRLRTRLAYMELYDFANLNILAALRLMCGRLVLKAESQQVDRILVAFSKRWCECNPDHGFKGNDVVHTICYSLLLLNTDLHLADIEQKMTRSQFVKNTMPTIRKSVADSAPDAFEPVRASILPGKSSTFEINKAVPDQNTKPERASIEIERPSWRSSFRPLPLPRSDSEGITPTPLDYDTPQDDCGPLVKAPFHGTLRTWEVQVEIVLKDFYNSIRNERLPLFGAPEKSTLLPPSNSLSVFTNGMLRRSPSVLSKAPSEAQSYARGRTAETVRGTGKWASKNRSRPRLYPGSGMGSSRTSLDDQSSMWSPSVSSSTWSKYSLGKAQTQTSMSVDSFGSSWPQGDYQQSIGFANALSQAIIREETIGSAGSAGSDREEPRVAPLLEDESLELHGAPWAKEGIVKHKHHLESVDKKSKIRNWNEVFAVIEKGYMSLFSFSAKSMRNKSKGKAIAAGVVGGGNWQENAQSLGSFLLRQTIASALPSPGYSKARPHVWALSLPTGAVHLFQVGTPDIVKEFVSSANYWSARLSNHPLVGGISNIEYGWSDAIVNNALVNAINDSTRPSTSGARPSIQSSLRSSLDQSYTSSNPRARLPGDKITISDWSPPTQSMRSSNLMEQDQLKTLTDYVTGIEEELQKHNMLRSPMLLAFSPRHPNSVKAMQNWERKSSYLLREIVKFRTYIDCLQSAEVGKKRIYQEREEREKEKEEREERQRKAKEEKGDEDEDEEEGDVTLRPE